ncbi:helix-turn-helix domain-containing protein [Sporosarcina sp. Te-1]|uniref:helix-turn-helix domain-containing protein n=1 Tax=Sporosarcina sp. Te-1 TaxID=2818390 RepID=UPI001AA00307|nr:helix-turn-helix transcriptional regulator [Sporosarcina sp. Te-1]QTD40641.1 helix-turn-helix transcriptional regulator [Sporosarcina sp. Te-1]
MDVGKRIREVRESRGMEQFELANRINISQSKMNKIETGFQKRLETDILVLISDVLGVTVDYLLGKSYSPHLSKEEEFQAFAHDPELKRWYRELPESDEEDLRKLRQMWEIIRSDKNKNKQK